MVENEIHIGANKRISWRDIGRYTQELTELIADSGFKPELIVGIARGGLIPAALLAIRLRLPLISMGVAKKDQERQIVPNPLVNYENLKDKKILLVEDMFEAGKSADTAQKFLQENGAEVKTACYFTSNISEIQPDYVLQQGITNKVAFPWES